MRKKAVLILCGFLIIFTLSCFLWGNALISLTLEHTLQAMIGAKVEIEGFRFRPFLLRVQMERMQITNPADTWKNLVSAQKIDFKLAPEPLFKGKTVIEQIIVEDLVFNEQRRTDGRIKKKASAGSKAKKESKLSRTIATMLILKPETISANLDLEKITAAYQFKTDLSAARIKEEIDTYQEKWDANLGEVNQLKVELESLEEKAAKLKAPNNLQEFNTQLALVKEIQEAVEKIHTNLEAANDRFQKDNQALAEMIQGLSAEAEADYQALLALAKLPDLGGINFAEALLGETVFNASTVLIEVIDQLRNSLPAKEDKSARVKPRRGGQDIAFPRRNSYPRFLIKKIAISGRGTPGSSMDGFYANGMITGITGEPSLYGLPLTVALFAQTPQQAIFRLDGELNHVIPEFQDEINLTVQGLSLPQFDLGDSHYLPTKIFTGKVGIDAVANMDPKGIKLGMVFNAKHIKTDFSGQPKPKDLIAEVVRKTLTDLEQVMLQYELAYSNGEFDIKISSNLNRLISQGLSETVGEKATRFTNDLRARVDDELHKQKSSLERVKQDYQEKVDTKLNELQEHLGLSEQKLAAKQRELKEKKKALENALQKKLDAEEKKLEEKVDKELRKLKDLL